jgi:adenosylhomocysteine nucleosidase
MIVVTFALPQESREFRRSLRAAGGQFKGEDVCVVHLGVGPASAKRRIAPLMAEAPHLVVCAGFAGALDPRLRTGDLVIAENFSTPHLLPPPPATPCGHLFVGPLVTQSSPVETAAAKRELGRESGALAVDMETASVAEACRAADVPLLAVRVISDDFSTPLPVPYAEWFDAARQRPQPGQLLCYLLRHPGSIGPFLTFLRGLRRARHNLSGFLLKILHEPR